MILFLVLIIKHPSKADTGNIPESKHTGKEMKQENNIKKTTYGAKAPQTKPRIVFKAVKAGKENHMTLGNLLINYSELINDKTLIYIRNDFTLVALGNWYQDNILKYHDIEISAFTWQDNNELYIDLKEGE